MTQDTSIRDAATLIMLRDEAARPSVLMGQRGAGAVFMPGKFVFPGGAVDAVDGTVPMATPLSPICENRLQEQSTLAPKALAAAAIRELWEETGQILGRKGLWDSAPRGWRGFAATGHLPHAGALTYVFRAVTPPGRTRRFDARFFLADADALASDPDDFGGAEDELAHLQWIPLGDVRKFDLPFITQVVLAEIAKRLRDGTKADLNPPESVPFFQNKDEALAVARLNGVNPLD
jgi:8-oxo-dGTP pyrophosphatase MutT (NUDIX family)